MSTRAKTRKREDDEDKAAEALHQVKAPLKEAPHSVILLQKQNAELREQNAILQSQNANLEEQVNVLQEQIAEGARSLTGRALRQASLQAGQKNAENVERIRKQFKGKLTAGKLSFTGTTGNPYNMWLSETDKCFFCAKCWLNDGTIRIFLSSQVVLVFIFFLGGHLIFNIKAI
jgi:predicted RNase H-like nuclease (RuvC/YqgF family)